MKQAAQRSAEAKDTANRANTKEEPSMKQAAQRSAEAKDTANRANTTGRSSETTKDAGRKKKRVLLLALLVFLVLLLLWLFLRKPSKPASADASGLTERRDVLLAWVPSPEADAESLDVLRSAASQLYGDITGASAENRMALLTPSGSTWQTVSLPDADTLSAALLSEAGAGTGALDAALRSAKDWNGVREGAEGSVILLTDRAPSESTPMESALSSGSADQADGTDGMDGPYDALDTPAYAAANTVYSAAADLTASLPLTVVSVTRGLTGSVLDFTRRFYSDIQTAGFYEIPDAARLAELRQALAADLLAENGAKKLTFRYEHGRDHTAVCYYSDQYFADSAYTYNPSLATMSISFAMSAFASGDQPRYANKSANVRALLQDIGVKADAVGVNEWFTLRPETDSVAVAAGSKEITVSGGTYTLIAAAVRGGGYGREWASNFTLGETGLHKGFSEARDIVLDYLKTYIAEQNITGPVKFWLTGFSRAAATANLVGGALDDGVDFGADITYGPEDVYAYCFEPPAGALTEEVRGQSRYYNIFNIVNQSDPVPFVAPSPLGFGRYGMDRFLPSAQSSSSYLTERTAMLRLYRAMEGADPYTVDGFHMKKLDPLELLSRNASGVVADDEKNNYSQGVFLSDYVSLLAKEYIRDRANYAARYENEIREVCSIVFGCTEEQQTTLMSALKERAMNHWGDVVVAFLNPLVSREEAFSIVSDWLVESVDEAGVTDYDEATLRSAGTALSDLLLNVLSQHPNYAATLAANIGGVVEAHSWELCYAWMASMDPNYKRGAEISFNNGSYRVVRVNCDVDVEVRDSDGAVVAEIVDETPRDVRGSAIISAINENGEKIVILPFDSAYTISVTARDADGTSDGSGIADGTAALSGISVGTESGGNEGTISVNVGIDEYSAQLGDYARGVDYLDLSLSAGETLTGELPAAPDSEPGENAPTAYTLESPAGDVLDSASDLSGGEAGTVYTVTVRSEPEAGGVALGGGPARYGDFVQAEAAAGDGYTFAGWYQDGGADPVSTETAYRLSVTADTVLTARFAVLPQTADAGANSGANVGSNGGAIPAFGDVAPASYCYDAVQWAVGQGIASGTTENTFSPQEPCTAAQAVTFLWRAAGSPAPSSDAMPFRDVDASAYYADAVRWAAERDVSLGTTADTFSPDRTVSRSQFITLFYRAFGEGGSTLENPFRDVDQEAYYRDAVAWANARSITRGTSPVTFGPAEPCTRGQVVTFLYRFFV